MTTNYFPPNERIVHHTSVDFKKRPITKPVDIAQYDNKLPLLEVGLYMDGVEYSVPSGDLARYTFRIRVGKPDRTMVYADAVGIDATRHRLYFEITRQMTLFTGTLWPVVEMMVDGQMVASSSPIIIKVSSASFTDGDTTSVSEYAGILGLVESIKDLTVYDIVIRSQQDFTDMLASSNWKGAKTVAILAEVSTSGIYISPNVCRIDGFGVGKILSTGEDYDGVIRVSYGHEGVVFSNIGLRFSNLASSYDVGINTNNAQKILFENVVFEFEYLSSGERVGVSVNANTSKASVIFRGCVFEMTGDDIGSGALTIIRIESIFNTSVYIENCSFLALGKHAVSIHSAKGVVSIKNSSIEASGYGTDIIVDRYGSVIVDSVVFSTGHIYAAGNTTVTNCHFNEIANIMIPPREWPNAASSWGLNDVLINKNRFNVLDGPVITLSASSPNDYLHSRVIISNNIILCAYGEAIDTQFSSADYYLVERNFIDDDPYQ